MIIDHFGFGVSDYERAKAFYAEALAPLGIALVMEFGPEQTEGKVWACGFGKGGKPELWIGSDGKTTTKAPNLRRRRCRRVDLEPARSTMQ